jgi:hypothetical protein
MMSPLVFLLSALLTITRVTALKFTDALVAPTPADRYQRFVTFLAVGTRTYVCDPANRTSIYTLKSFNYDMYDAETDPGRKFNLGKHVLMLQKDVQGGNSVFYTANNTFTYWCAIKIFYCIPSRIEMPLTVIKGWQDYDSHPGSPCDQPFGSDTGARSAHRGFRAKDGGRKI